MNGIFYALFIIITLTPLKPTHAFSLTAKNTPDAPAVKAGITFSTPEQLKQRTSPQAQGFLDRLTFATPQYGGNGTGTSCIPFSISGRPVSRDGINNIALQPDGCIVIAGLTTATNGSSYFAVARYLPSGMLDPNFGQINSPRAGTAYVPFAIAGGGTDDEAYAVALQSDGKIVLAGVTNRGVNERFAVARFTSSGTLDTATFGQIGTPLAGTAYIPFPIINGGASGVAESIVIQNDGKIVVGGTGENAGGVNRFEVARFTPAGILDSSFGQTETDRAGTAFVPFGIAGPGGTNDQAFSIALQSDGKIVLGGTGKDAGALFHFALARFTPTGILDTSFGQTDTDRAGTAYVPFPIAGGGLATAAGDVALQSDGKIVLGGVTTDAGGATRFALARFTSAGTLDTTFGQKDTDRAGTAYVPFSIAGGGGVNDVASNVALQSDGKIVLAGRSTNGGGACYGALARFTAEGVLDRLTFGNVGKSTAGTTYIPFSISDQTQFDRIEGIALQPNGAIIAGVSSSNGSINTPPVYFSVARFVNQQLDS